MGNTDSKVIISIRGSGELVETRARKDYKVQIIFQLKEWLKLSYGSIKKWILSLRKPTSLLWAVIRNGMPKDIAVPIHSLKATCRNSNIYVISIHYNVLKEAGKNHICFYKISHLIWMESIEGRTGRTFSSWWWIIWVGVIRSVLVRDEESLDNGGGCREDGVVVHTCCLLLESIFCP